MQASLSGHVGAATVSIGLTSPITAIGAPAPTYYPRVGQMVGVQAIVPAHADVANAVGAVVGRVRVRRSATITQPTRGQYRVHLEDQPTFGSVDRARAHATERLHHLATAEAEVAGADTPRLSEDWQQRVAEVNGKEIFVEGILVVEAAGRPRL